MPLDQRQRLQHGVVHARGDVGALVAADPGGALGVAVEREPPHPGPGDQQQRAGDGARREQRRVGAVAREERDGADRGQRDAAVGERRVGPEAAALAPGQSEPGRDQGDADDRPVGEAEGAEQQAAREEREHGRDPAPRRAGVRPQRQVEHDPRAAREGEQREDEPDEGDVDREGLRDTCADPRDHPVVRARSEARPQHAGSS